MKKYYDFDRHLFYFALYVFCMDWHSGQWSRGYRIMSRFHNKHWNIRLTDSVEKEARESEYYADLEERYANKV